MVDDHRFHSLPGSIALLGMGSDDVDHFLGKPVPRCESSSGNGVAEKLSVPAFHKLSILFFVFKQFSHVVEQGTGKKIIPVQSYLSFILLDHDLGNLHGSESYSARVLDDVHRSLIDQQSERHLLKVIDRPSSLFYGFGPDMDCFLSKLGILDKLEFRHESQEFFSHLTFLSSGPSYA